MQLILRDDSGVERVVHMSVEDVNLLRVDELFGLAADIGEAILAMKTASALRPLIRLEVAAK